jgi:hypothetical protein
MRSIHAIIAVFGRFDYPQWSLRKGIDISLNNLRENIQLDFKLLSQRRFETSSNFTRDAAPDQAHSESLAHKSKTRGCPTWAPIDDGCEPHWAVAMRP